MTQTLHRADYAYSEAAEHLNLPTATIIDMVNNGTLEHTGCGKRITRDSLQAAMAPESEQTWLHGEKALQVKDGGWYKRRDGEIVGPAIKFDDERYPWQVGEQLIYTSIGKFHFDGAKDSRDLICELPPPIDGYRPTGEFRVPVKGQDARWFQQTELGWRLVSWLIGASPNGVQHDGKRWIAEKIPDEAEELTEADVDSPPERQPQHTPGPWGVEQTQTTNWIGPLRADGKVDRIVAHNDRHNLTPTALAERDANARLIAQAPSFENTIEECLGQRDEAEAAADELASLVLNEPVDWAFHNEAWQRAVEQLKDAKSEPNCTLPTTSPHEGCHVVQPEKEPQPGEWWEYSLNGLRGVAYCCGRFLNGRLLWQDHPNRGYIKLFRQSLIRHLPDCTGFDYELPPEQTPAERRLREVGLEEHNGDYLKPTGKVGVTYSISWRHWTAKQVEAIAAHMREQIGGAE